MENKLRILVTGASHGIGRAITKKLTDAGHDVTAAARGKEALSALQKETGCRTAAGDVGCETFVRGLFDTIRNEGGLDVLINNAGISYIGLLQDMSLDEWNRIFRTNITSMFLTCREAIPVFLARGRGSIVNVSSVWGNVGASCEVAYSATKGAVNSFTRALAKELAPSNIRVNAAAFGTIDTSMNGFLSDEERRGLEEEIAMGRFGSPEEAADLVIDLALRNPYLTGEVVTMDGGWI
jgi:3-oxoacyl-[acyl-carrier protein] reductase